MRGCTEWLMLALVVLGTAGCLGGHLFDAARRRELPRAVTAAAVDDERLLVAYTAAVTTDLGRPVGECARRAAVPLAEVTDALRTADAFSVERIETLGGQAVPVVPVLPATPVEASPSAPLLRILDADDPARARLLLETPARVYPAFPLAAFTRAHYERWVWVVLPFALAGDAVIVPVLIVLAPAVMLVGD